MFLTTGKYCSSDMWNRLTIPQVCLINMQRVTVFLNISNILMFCIGVDTRERRAVDSFER